MPVLGIDFILRITGMYRKINQRYFFVFIFLPSLIFSFAVISNLEHYYQVKSEYWNRIFNPAFETPTLIIYLWLCIVAIILMVLPWIGLMGVIENERDKKLTLVLALGLTVPILTGIIFEVFYPIIAGIDALPVTTLSVSVFSIAALYCITKLHMLEFTPKHEWKSIVNTMGEGLVIFNTKNEIMFVNKRFCEMTGFSVSEIKGKTIKQFFGGESPSKNSNFFANEDSVNQRTELSLTDKTGNKKWLLAGYSPYKNREGKIIGFTGIYACIDELKYTQKKLNDKISELNSFFYKSSHDLRAPAINIQGLLNLHKGEEKSLINNVAILKQIELCNSKMLEILNGLAMIPVISQSNVDLKNICLNTEIEKQACKVRTRYPGIQIALKTQNSIHMVSDEFLMGIILFNLFENAAKFSAPERNCYTEVDVTQEKEKVVMKISDNGIGIDMHNGENFFDLFFRGNLKSGIGLGLYTTRSAVAKLGGTIAIEGNLHGGTTVKLEIPKIKPSYKIAVNS